ncbi:MAG: UDP-N-acetyl-D-glucosamine 6-dehydrogenase, partial [uncultured Gemmatimonadaceae bacterium]
GHQRSTAQQDPRPQRGRRHRRPRLRGTAARDGVRARRLPRRRLRRERAGRRAAQRRVVAHPGRAERGGRGVRALGPLQRDARGDPPARVRRDLDRGAHAALEDARPRHGLRPLGHRRRAAQRARGARGGAREHHLPGHHARAHAAALREDRAHGRRGRLPGLQPRAGRPGERAVSHEEHAEGGGRDHPRLRGDRQGALRVVHRHRGARLVARGRRAGEAAREHLPLGEHRPRERDGDHLRQAGRRRVGGRGGGGHQAVRLHEVHPRPRDRRPLHPARPALPRVEDAHAQLQDAVHRPRERVEQPHALLRHRQGVARAQRRPQGRQRELGARRRGGLQAQHRRHPREPGARRDPAARGAGRVGGLPRPVHRVVPRGGARAPRRRPHPQGARRLRRRRDRHRPHEHRLPAAREPRAARHRHAQRDGQDGRGARAGGVALVGHRRGPRGRRPGARV